MSYLPFLSDEVLVKIVKHVLAQSVLSEDNFYKNSIDPFSAVFQASIEDITLTKWIDLERMRQGQKTLQNKLGDFHQYILGHMNGWEDLGVGKIVDIKNDEKKIIAEIKNKHNTVKGSDKIVIYDNLNYCVTNLYQGYVGYFVEIIPKNKKRFDSLFTPSDNKLKSKREEDKNIRQIDGASFYDLASGHKDSLRLIYEVLPSVISDQISTPLNKITKDPLFPVLFEQTFS